MPGLYLGLLLLSLAGLAHLDNRVRLVFYAPGTPRFQVHWRSVGVTLIGIAFFAAWDSLGIANHIFFTGVNNFLLGIQLFPNFPIEEVLFLTLLVYCGQLAQAGWLRLSKRAKAEEAA